MNSLDNCINFLLTGAQHSVFQYMKKNLAMLFAVTAIAAAMTTGVLTMVLSGVTTSS